MTLILRQSRIHSYGCYTTRPIRKGNLVVEYVGEYLTYEQADDLYDNFPNTYLFGLDGGKRIIDGYGVAAFVNHSCKPNCETDQIRGKMWIIALRDIEAGTINLLRSSSERVPIASATLESYLEPCFRRPGKHHC